MSYDGPPSPEIGYFGSELKPPSQNTSASPAVMPPAIDSARNDSRLRPRGFNPTKCAQQIVRLLAARKGLLHIPLQIGEALAFH